MTLIKANYGKNLFAKLMMCLLLMSNLTLHACASQKQIVAINQDSIIPAKKTYQGYRLQLTNIKVTNSKGKQRKINCTLINTGREKLRLPNNQDDGLNVIVQYDKTLYNLSLIHISEPTRPY